MLQIELIILIVMQLFVVAAPSRPAPPAGPVDFARDIRPILERRCQPCHFEGGSMHAKLPFDRPETVDKLGTKLFSRIKKEKEQELIRNFLARRR